MNFCNVIINYKMFFQMMIWWFINFNYIFGCLSTRHTKKGDKVPSLTRTVEDIVWNNLENESNIISNFNNFLVRKGYETNVIYLQHLWKNLKEFSIENGYTSRSCRLRKRKSNHRKSNLKMITLDDINRYLENEDKQINIKGASGYDKMSYKADIKNNEYFSNEEKQKAFSLTREFNDYGCTLRNETFCLKEFFKELNNGVDNLYQSLPPGLMLRRCPNKCSCISIDEECSPDSVQNRTEYIYRMKTDGKMSTLPLVLVDHIGCKCRKRCSNKKCISNFQLIANNGSCDCKCIPGKEKKCNKILDGLWEFTITDYNCIVSGKCTVPDCAYGNLSEELLYLRRCPRKF